MKIELNVCEWEKSAPKVGAQHKLTQANTEIETNKREDKNLFRTIS